ncbi:hypothetical protein P4S67_12350 [Pseudoalteromonas sp. B137]
MKVFFSLFIYEGSKTIVATDFASLKTNSNSLLLLSVSTKVSNTGPSCGKKSQASLDLIHPSPQLYE